MVFLFSDEMMSQLEILPNEIIINIFEYLNAPDLFNGFDGLNYRFQRLITNIPLNLNCQHITKTIFDQFCQTMLTNSEIKYQIISLTLSNEENTCLEINAFLSLFSLNEFPNLRSLTLIRIKEDEMERIASMLPSLFNLTYFHYDIWDVEDTFLAPLLLTNIRKFHAEYSNIRSICTHQQIYITHLTIYHCTLNDFKTFFTHIPMLRYLNVNQLLGDYCSEDKFNVTNIQAIYLKQFILQSYRVEFEDIEYILKQTPNLKILKLSINYGDDDIIDPNRWQKLISSFLPHLYIFKFDFVINKL